MKKSFSYIFGIVQNPLETIRMATKERRHLLLTICVILWDNILIMGFIGVITIYRFLLWDHSNIPQASEIVSKSLRFLLFSNVVLFLVALATALTLLIFRGYIKCKPSLLYSYLLNSFFLIVVVALAIIFPFFRPIGDRIIVIVFGFAAVTIFTFWSTTGYLGSCRLSNVNYAIFLIISLFAFFLMPSLNILPY